MLMLLFMGYVPFLSCSSDKDGEDDHAGGNAQSSLVGTWIMSDDDDVYVFKADGTGIGCEHADDTEQDLWHFNYTYSEATRTVTMRYDGKTDVFKDIVIHDDRLDCTDVDGDRLVLNKMIEPVPVFTFVTDPEYDADFINGNSCYKLGSEPCTLTVHMTAQLLWHKNHGEEVTLSVEKNSESKDMFSNFNFSGNGSSGTLTMAITKNSKPTERVSTISVRAVGKEGNQIRAKLFALRQSGIENRFEVSGMNYVSWKGGTVVYYVYNKDKAGITAYHPSGQSSEWRKLSTSKYTNGEDWEFRITLPANYSNEEKYYSYKFEKSDGSQITRTITQGEYAGGGNSGGGSGGNSGGNSGGSKCSICYGTGKCMATNCYKGKCMRCGGTGTGTLGKKCAYCNSGYCRTCGGTGKCKYCGGDGRI